MWLCRCGGWSRLEARSLECLDESNGLLRSRKVGDFLQKAAGETRVRRSCPIGQTGARQIAADQSATPFIGTQHLPVTPTPFSCGSCRSFTGGRESLQARPPLWAAEERPARTCAMMPEAAAFPRHPPLQQSTSPTPTPVSRIPFRSAALPHRQRITRSRTPHGDRSGRQSAFSTKRTRNDSLREPWRSTRKPRGLASPSHVAEWPMSKLRATPEWPEDEATMVEA